MSRRPAKGFDLYNWAWDQPLPGGPKVVLLALVKHADETGACYPKQATLADLTGLSRRAVRYYLADLEALGLIVRDRRRRKDGTRAADHYILTLRQAAPRATSGNDEPAANPDSDSANEHEAEAQAAPRATCAHDAQAAPRAAIKRHHVPHQAAPRAAQELTTRTDHKELTTQEHMVSAPEKAGDHLDRPRLTPRSGLDHEVEGQDEGQPDELLPPPSAFMDAWNDNCGRLPKVTKLNAARVAAIKRLNDEHGADALPMFRAAVREVANDEWWLTGGERQTKDGKPRPYGFDNLLRAREGDKVLSRYETHANREEQAAAARERRERIEADYAATFNLEPTEYRDVEPGDLLDGATVEGTFKPPARREPRGRWPGLADAERTLRGDHALPAPSSNGSPEPQPEPDLDGEHHDGERDEPPPAIPAPPARPKLTEAERAAKEAARKVELERQKAELLRQHDAKGPT